MILTRYFDQIHFGTHWEFLLGKKRMDILLASGILKRVGPIQLEGLCLQHEIDGRNGLREFVLINNVLHLMNVEGSGEPFQVVEQVYKLSRESAIDFFNRENKFSSSLIAPLLPKGFANLGCKAIEGTGGFLHVLAKDSYRKDDQSIIQALLENYQGGNERFLFLVENPEQLRGDIPMRYHDCFNASRVEEGQSELMVNPAEIYKAKFGFKYSQVQREVGAVSVVVDREQGRISFCGLEITNKPSDFSIVFTHLAECADEAVPISYLVDDLLNKVGEVNKSKIVRNLKDRFQGAVATEFGGNSLKWEQAKALWPDLPRAKSGFSMVSSKILPLILV